MSHPPFSSSAAMRVEEEQGRKHESFDWTLWAKWILVTTLGWLIAFALWPEPGYGQLGYGAVIGTAQWVVLRPSVREDGWWIPVSAAGWAGGVAVVSFLLPAINPIAAQAIIGGGMGLAQWLVLRWQVHRAWWWIVLSALGWTVAMMGILGGLLEGALAGAVTGFALELLLRHPREEASSDTADSLKDR